MSDLDLFASAGDGLDPSHFGLLDDGGAYVVAGPFAKALGYRDAEKATRLLDADEVGTQIVGMNLADGRKQQRSVSVIFEDGMWELIFRSTLPSAKTIKSRVKGILRELRETGVVDTREKRELSRLELIDLAREAELGRLEAVARAAELEPAAASWERLAEATGDYSLREAAQILDRDPAISTGQNRLSKYLKDVGWTDRTGQPYQRQVDAGRLVVRTRDFFNSGVGEEQVSTQLRITVRGLHELHKLMRGSGPLLISA